MDDMPRKKKWTEIVLDVIAAVIFPQRNDKNANVLLLCA